MSHHTTTSPPATGSSSRWSRGWLWWNSLAASRVTTQKEIPEKPWRTENKHTNHTNKNHLFQNLIDLHYGVPHAKSSKLVSFQFQNIPHTTSTTHMNMCTTHKNAVKTPFKKKLWAKTKRSSFFFHTQYFNAKLKIFSSQKKTRLSSKNFLTCHSSSSSVCSSSAANNRRYSTTFLYCLLVAKIKWTKKEDRSFLFVCKSKKKNRRVEV